MKGPKKNFVSDIEKHLFFPDLAGIEDISPLFIDEFFRECLEGALKNGELSGSININNVLVSLMTIHIGTLIAVKFSDIVKSRDIKSVKHHYLRQLQMLWTELGIKTGKEGLKIDQSTLLYYCSMGSPFLHTDADRLRKTEVHRWIAAGSGRGDHPAGTFDSHHRIVRTRIRIPCR